MADSKWIVTECKENSLYGFYKENGCKKCYNDEN